MIANPNEYDDDTYTLAVTDLHDVIVSLWNAGASLENLCDEISNALENATEVRTSVEITAR
jgi:hypothetical protein